MEINEEEEYIESQHSPLYSGAGNYITPPFTTSHADLIEKISPQKLAEELMHKLKNETYDELEKKWIRPFDSKPLINELGLSIIMSIATSYINDNTIYSNLTEQDIRALIIKLSKQLIFLLRCRYHEFEIEKAHLTTVKNLVLTTSYKALRRALDGAERKILAKTIFEQIVSQNKTPDDRDKFKPFKLFKG